MNLPETFDPTPDPPDARENRIRAMIFFASMAVVMWLLMWANSVYGAEPEAFYANELARVLGGKTEHVLPDGTRVDVLTEDVAFEVDFPERLWNGAAQALWYGKRTARKPGLYLIIRKDADQVWVDRARVFCNEHGILLFVHDARTQVPDPIPEPVPVPTPDPVPVPVGLLDWQRDAIYLGAWRVPESPSGTPDRETFSYGGYSPALGNGGMYLVGNVHTQHTAQITIPEPKIAPVGELPRAEWMQPFADATGGLRAEHLPGNVRIGGHMVWGGKLLTTLYAYYTGDPPEITHIVSELDLSNPQAQGIYRLGFKGAFVNGYMAPVPEPWRTALGAPVLTGQNSLSANQSSAGPAAFGFDPADLGVKSPVPVKPWLYYQKDTTAWTGRTLPGWEMGQRAPGCVFLPNAVLFVGERPVGKIWYGNGTEVIDGVTYTDPCSDSRGSHAEGTHAAIWLYDPAVFLAVANGEKQPWELRPYAEFPLPEINGDLSCVPIGGACYDPDTRRLYVVQLKGEPIGNYKRFPLIHVWELKQ